MPICNLYRWDFQRYFSSRLSVLSTIKCEFAEEKQEEGHFRF